MRWVAPVALAVVFGAAAGTKLADLGSTARGFEGLGLPAPDLLARIVPLVELALAVTLIAAPSVGGWLAGLTLVAFTGFLLVRRRTHPGVPCRCFGAVGDRPIGAADLVRNAVLIALAAITVIWPPGA